MALTLVLVGKDPLPSGQKATLRIDRRTATVGRGKDNDWVLQDPDRYLSSKHCAIEFKSGQYYVVDTSMNGVYINDSAEQLGRGNAAPLHDRDRLRLGQYEIEVQITSDESAEQEPFEPLASDPFVGGLHGSHKGATEEPNSQQGTPGGAFASWTEERAVDSDVFDPDRPAKTGVPRAEAAEPSRELIPDDADIFGAEAKRDEWRGPSESDHVPSERQCFAAPRVRINLIPDDWDKEPAGEGPASTSSPGAVTPPVAGSGAMKKTAHMLAQGGSGELAPLRPSHPDPAVLAAAASSAVSPAEARALCAFLEGAGIPGLQVSDAAATEMMRTLGKSFRAIVAGLRAVLMARASIKSEFRVEQTMIRPVDNNPLKFSVSDEEAMLALLRPSVPGYVSAERALGEALSDIEVHQLAVMAGLQAALAALLKRFDPKNLEQQLKQSSLLASVLPSARKAMYWDVFTRLYDQIAREAEDDFHGYLGRDFARAYKEQTKKS